jgi:hypothetical protein
MRQNGTISTNLTNNFYYVVNDQSPTNFATISEGSVLFGDTAIIEYPRGDSMIHPLDPATGKEPAGCDTTMQSKNMPWRCRGYGAAKCSLYPCIRTYQANMTNGKFVETVVSETVTQKKGHSTTHPHRDG